MIGLSGNIYLLSPSACYSAVLRSLQSPPTSNFVSQSLARLVGLAGSKITSIMILPPRRATIRAVPRHTTNTAGQISDYKAWFNSNRALLFWQRLAVGLVVSETI